MIFKWIAYFVLANLIVPFLNAYVFFLNWGYFLKDERLRLEIESPFFVPQGAIFAALLGLLFTMSGTLPLSILNAILIRALADTKYRWILFVISLLMGSALGFLIQSTHFKSLFQLEFGFLGGISGVLITWIGIEITAKKQINDT